MENIWKEYTKEQVLRVKEEIWAMFGEGIQAFRDAELSQERSTFYVYDAEGKLHLPMREVLNKIQALQQATGQHMLEPVALQANIDYLDALDVQHQELAKKYRGWSNLYRYVDYIIKNNFEGPNDTTNLGHLHRNICDPQGTEEIEACKRLKALL